MPEIDITQSQSFYFERPPKTDDLILDVSYKQALRTSKCCFFPIHGHIQYTTEYSLEECVFCIFVFLRPLKNFKRRIDKITFLIYSQLYCYTFICFKNIKMIF